jgi:hypothetical protein
MDGTSARLVVLAMLAGAVLLVLGSWLWYRLRPVDRYEIGEVAVASGLTITADNAGIVADAVARTRLWRTLGVLAAIVGLGVAAYLQWSADSRLDVPLTVLLWGLVGYWAGSVVAELATARSMAGDGPRSASLTPREMPQYVGAWAAQWPFRLAVIGALASAVAVLAGGREWWIWASGVGAVVVALVTRAVSRYVLDRPQPVLAVDVAAADDAVRSRSLHALGGTAVGIGIWLASLAFGGAVLTLAARSGVDVALDSTSGGEGVSSLLQALALFVTVALALVVPIVGFIVGRRLARRPFAVPTAVRAAP